MGLQLQRPWEVSFRGDVQRFHEFVFFFFFGGGGKWGRVY